MRMRLAAPLALILGLCSLLLPSSAVNAAELAQAGRDIVAKWQNTVLPIEIVTKMHMPGGGDATESKSEIIGTLIDPTGLIVTSLSSTDPMASLIDSMANMMGSAGDAARPQSEITSVNILFPEGKAVPAQIVLRDKDLDLAFIRTLKPLEQPVSALDLTQAGDPGLLDEVLLMSRLGTMFSRSIAMSHADIKAVVEKPRKYFVLDSANQDTGIPAFLPDGRFIGLVVQRTPPKGAASPNDMMSVLSGLFSGKGMAAGLQIILPASTIATIAKQAGDGGTKPVAEGTKPK